MRGREQRKVLGAAETDGDNGIDRPSSDTCESERGNIHNHTRATDINQRCPSEASVYGHLMRWARVGERGNWSLAFVPWLLHR